MADPLRLVEVHELVEVVAALRQQEVGGHESDEAAEGNGEPQRSDRDPGEQARSTRRAARVAACS